MNTPSTVASESPLQPGIASAAVVATRPLYWSVRRELWECRSMYLAPFGVAAVFLFGFLISVGRLPHHMRVLDPAKQHEALVTPYELATGLIMGTAFILGFYYTIEALQAERRDRSILFWKSLPVSDLTTVLAKASIPIVILPLLSYVITVATQLIMLLLTSAVLLGSGMSATPLWTQLSLFQNSLGLLYHLVTVHMLWYAPIYAWLLLVSVWARRVAFLWAILPPLVVFTVEKIAFNTSHFASFVVYRFTGPQDFNMRASSSGMVMPLQQLGPGQFFSTPGLWVGLLAAAVFLVAAARLRRYRGPI